MLAMSMWELHINTVIPHFLHIHIALPKLIQFIYMWSIDMPQSTIINELDLNKNTVMDWYNFMCDVCDEFVAVWWRYQIDDIIPSPQ